jgi:predicted O-linked N-acetylglucosamine transferase (SPINDLY family)
LHLAAAELEIDHPEQSAKHAQQAIRIAPQMVDAHTMLGNAYRVRGQYTEALQAYGRAEQLAPEESKHAYQIGLMLDELHRLDEAEKAYARAAHLDKSNVAALSQQIYTLRRLYRWDDLDTLSNQLRKAVADGVTGVMPFSFLAEDVSADEQLHCAKNFAATIENQTAAVRQRLNFKHSMPAPDTPMRVGFVSDGFGEHPTGMLIVAMLESLQSSGIEIHFYATAPSDKSPVRKRLENVGKMHQIHGLSRAVQAQRIHSDKIEVLIDTSVYCECVNARLFALRPAPLQVNWLGYPGSSGAPWLDYMLADKVVQPDHLRSATSEKLVRLSRCFQPSDTVRTIRPAPSRERCGLPQQGVVFACFNTNYKINPKAFGLFLSILAQTPRSVLWLLSSSDDMDQRLVDEAAKVHIAADRLIFMPRPPYADYLSRYEHVDLFLDTSPHNARMPAYDALSAGCPVLTCAGETFASRITASMLMHVDLPELIAEDEASFVALAVSLGGNHEALQLLRHHLAQQRSGGKLFDMDGYASDFRRAVQAMVARRRIGRPAADIDIS